MVKAAAASPAEAGASPGHGCGTRAPYGSDYRRETVRGLLRGGSCDSLVCLSPRLRPQSRSSLVCPFIGAAPGPPAPWAGSAALHHAPNSASLVSEVALSLAVKGARIPSPGFFYALVSPRKVPTHRREVLWGDCAAGAGKPTGEVVEIMRERPSDTGSAQPASRKN